MHRHGVIIALASALWLGAATAASSASSLSLVEKTAFKVRHLQIELMVAALSCGRADYRMQYDTFARKYVKQLVAHGRVLRRYFARRYGVNAVPRLDRYITAASNQASLRSMTAPDFCAGSGDLFHAVTRSGYGRLSSFVAQPAFDRLNGRHPVDPESAQNLDR